MLALTSRLYKRNEIIGAEAGGALSPSVFYALKIYFLQVFHAEMEK